MSREDFLEEVTRGLGSEEGVGNNQVSEGGCSQQRERCWERAWKQSGHLPTPEWFQVGKEWRAQGPSQCSLNWPCVCEGGAWPCL